MKKRKKKKEFSLKQQYVECFKFLKESRNFLIMSLVVFAIFLIIGIAFPVFFVEEILKYIEELVALTEGLDFLGLLWFIFKNNFLASISALALGIFLGLFPIFALILNAYILGFVMRAVIAEAGFLQLWRLIPHGIFEFPAILISISLGIRVGMVVFTDKDKIGQELAHRLKNSFRVFLYIILPLLIIAAIIETTLIFLAG